VYKLIDICNIFLNVYGDFLLYFKTFRWLSENSKHLKKIAVIFQEKS
jgi:hypothetical protein